MTGFFSLLLWFGSILCFIGYGINQTDPSNLYLGIVLAGVTLITGFFTFYQTSKSASLMAKFKNFIPPKAVVRREGRAEAIEAKELVRGDIVIVKGGDNIPADLRIIEANEMKVNNASLTGETEELLRTPNCTDDKPFETENLAFFGTSCTEGTGVGIVIFTGDNTVIGKIANLAQSAKSSQTTLSIEIHRFIKIISLVAIFLGVSFFIAGVVLKYGIITNLVFAIGIIVANVPEGLLATVTVSLALTAKRMASKNVLVKNLESVETLGSTSCICSDKTGTLTKNIMTVSHLWFGGRLYDAANNKQEWEKGGQKRDLGYPVDDPDFVSLMENVVLGTRASFTYNPTEDDLKRYIARMILKKKVKKVKDREIRQYRDRARNELLDQEKTKMWKDRHTTGDASESGLIKFAEPILSLEDTRRKAPMNVTPNETKCEIPFNSSIKYNVMIRDMRNYNGEESHIIMMKGAPERIWQRCSKVRVNGEDIERTEEWDEKFKQINSELGGLGERVLAFSRMRLDQGEFPRDFEFNVKKEQENFPLSDGYTFMGLVSLNDPPRDGVRRSVEMCRDAGIKVIMVTGDQPTTAAAIAQKVSILTSDNFYIYLNKDKLDKEALAKAEGIVIHGDVLAKMHFEYEALSDEERKQRGNFLIPFLEKREVVFSRTSPSQKLLIVNGCQSLNHIVAVTGDGVNDSPAIKKANIGVAMGIVGSDVAKDAADMLLLDDNFNSIVKGVEEGRLIFDNLKKSIAYTLSSNIPEIAPFIFFIIFQVPLPLSTVLILCIDLGTDMVPAISFAYENAELDIMHRKPRNSKMDHLVNAKLISFSYLQIGMVQMISGFYTYFWVMYDYGFKPQLLFGLNRIEGTVPGETDSRLLVWETAEDNEIDTRFFYTSININEFAECRYWDKSWVSDRAICYTTEALRYAQCAYFVSIVIVQWSDLMICKTRNLSLFTHGMRNNFANFGLFFETALACILCYVPFLQLPLGTRPLRFFHFMVPSVPFFCAIIIYDEIRKLLLRKGIDERGRKIGWVARNTYY